MESNRYQIKMKYLKPVKYNYLVMLKFIMEKKCKNGSPTTVTWKRSIKISGAYLALEKTTQSFTFKGSNFVVEFLPPILSVVS